MKTDRFDQIVKDKIGKIAYTYEQHEVDTIHEYVKSNSSQSWFSKLFHYKSFLLYTILLSSIAINIFYFTKNSALLADETEKMQVRQLAKYDANAKNILSSIPKENEQTEVIYPEVHIAQAKSMLNIRQETIKPSAYELKSSMVGKLFASSYKNNITKLNSTDVDLELTAVKNIISNVEVNASSDGNNLVSSKASQSSSDFEKMEMTLSGMALLPMPTINLQIQKQELSALPIIVEASPIKPLDITKAKCPKWEAGVNGSASLISSNVGMMAMYNISPKISVFASANKYISANRHFESLSDYDDSSSKNISEKYFHDFSDYNSLSNLRERLEGYVFTIGATYAALFKNNYRLIGNVSSSFHLASNSALSFQYTLPQKPEFGQKMLHAIDRDFRVSHISAGMGVGKRIGSFDVNLLFNSNFSGEMQKHHDMHIDWTPSLEGRFLYGF